MAKVSMSTELGASAATVWELIADFNGLPKWNVDIEKSVLEKGGKHRRLHLTDGSVLVERLDRLDDRARSCTYSIIEGDDAVRNYQAIIQVREKGERCTVAWSSTFEPVGNEQAVTEVIRSIYNSGFAGLRKIYGA